MDESDIETEDAGVSRRKVIKAIGAGTAVAWSAPTVLGLGPRAMAASVAPPVECTGCNPADSCFGQSPCGDASFGCTCKPPEVGAGNPCICTGNGFCNEFQVCDSQSDCPPGYTCTHSCCDGFVGSRLCLPNCGTPHTPLVGARMAPSGPRTDGQ